MSFLKSKTVTSFSWSFWSKLVSYVFLELIYIFINGKRITLVFYCVCKRRKRRTLLHALQHGLWRREMVPKWRAGEWIQKEKNVQCLRLNFCFLSGSNDDQLSIWIREDDGEAKETFYSMELITRKGHLSPCTTWQILVSNYLSAPHVVA